MFITLDRASEKMVCYIELGRMDFTCIEPCKLISEFIEQYSMTSHYAIYSYLQILAPSMAKIRVC